ncbi:N-acetyltransferase family protein [Aeromonas molluscorum]|uniref:GNAT family N-acetyltransferase n=1 Tax=Aeromonas molluscorum TaxID=271417 RepID=UPI003F1DEB83
MIRLASVEDAAALDHFFGQLDRETRFMLFEAGERSSDIEGQRQRQRLAAMHASANQRMWLLTQACEVQGFAVMIGGGLRRNRHCAQVVMGLRQGARSQGWGELKRLELGVMAHNLAAHGLYRKCGFIDEGTRRNAYWLDTRHVDEIIMGLLLPLDMP